MNNGIFNIYFDGIGLLKRMKIAYMIERDIYFSMQSHKSNKNQIGLQYSIYNTTGVRIEGRDGGDFPPHWFGPSPPVVCSKTSLGGMILSPPTGCVRQCIPPTGMYQIVIQILTLCSDLVSHSYQHSSLDTIS